MIRSLIDGTGAFFWPQLALQVFTAGIVVADLVALKRGEVPAGTAPWEKHLGWLSAFATSIGLFGTVVGFIQSFACFRGSIDVQRVSAGLAVAFWTTFNGMITSMVAMAGEAILGLVGKER